MNTRWIWHPGLITGTNTFCCFRKSIRLNSTELRRTLEISADSRYVLYVNGRLIGYGPGRYWPEKPWIDSYEIESLPETNGLTIAVLVWSFGVSTSQYIHAQPGLTVELASGKEGRLLGTDESWRCRRHAGYVTDMPRINISQPRIEQFDARMFPADWFDPEFDDGDWEYAVDVSGSFESRHPELSPVPLLESRRIEPVSATGMRVVRPKGTGFRIDYRESFYPGDRSTEDKLHSGYLCTCICSPENQIVTLTLGDRRWPLTAESFIVNGERHSIESKENSGHFPLKQGDNLFLFDITGTHQRLWADLHFQSPESMDFNPPLQGYTESFLAIGPFETFPIGNIVCIDGFSLDTNHPDYRTVGSCRSCEELSVWQEKVPDPPAVYADLPKHLGTMKDIITPISKQNPPENIDFPANSRGDREVLVDMGKEVSGYLGFTLEAPSGAILDILFFEYLKPGNEPEIPMDLDTSLRVIASGTKFRFRSMLRRGFRYMLITLRSPGRAGLREISVDQRLYPVTREGRFTCSDKKLNAIDEICLRTLRLCREDTYVDCPAFEQALWIGDVHAMSRVNHSVFGDNAITAHSLRLTADSLNYSFLPDCHLPAGVHLQLTTWSLLWILTCADHYRRTGDNGFRRSIVPAVNLTLNRFLTLINDEGLLEIAAWNMLDWAGMDTPYRGIIAHLNAWFAEALDAGTELSDTPEEPPGRFRKTAENLRTSLHRKFWDDSRRAYRDCFHEDGTPSEVFSVQTQLTLLHCHAVPPEHIDEVKHFVLSPTSESVGIGSPFLAGFFLEFLFSERKSEHALDEIRRLWGPMIDAGSSTCWETFEGFYVDRLTRSYCHGWSSTPADLLRRHVLGIPEDAGIQKSFQLHPDPGGLDFAEGSVPVPGGEITVSWKITDNRFDCHVCHPPGYSIEIIIPTGLTPGDIA